MNEQLPAGFLDLAHKLADAAGEVSMAFFRTPVDVNSKSDDSPVTIADRNAELAMRRLIEETFPEHGIYGEETEKKNIDAEFVWVLDPIDGTQSFVTGKPLFGTLIGLAHNGSPVLGIMDMPALNERWVGCPGQQTTFNGKDVRVRACSSLDNAWLYATSPQMFDTEEFHCFESLRRKTRRAVYGAECYAYGLVANGSVDLVVEADLEPYDYCALAPIVTGAGGIMTDWHGKPLSIESDGRVIAAGDQKSHTAALESLVLQS